MVPRSRWLMVSSSDRGAQYLFATAASPTALESGKYPFSVLGLGDIVIPGAFVTMLRQIDLERSVQPPLAGFIGKPYFTAGIVAYSAGLLACFAANSYSGVGQPALVYIVPALLFGSAATAVSRGESRELFAFESERAREAEAAMRNTQASGK